MSKAKKSKCLYCGNNPTNHFVSFFMQTISVPLSPVFRLFYFLNLPFFKNITKTILTPYLWFFQKLRLLKMNSDSSKAVSDRSLVIWLEAEKRGIKMEQFVILNKPIEQYRAKINGRWQYFESIPIPMYLPQRSYIWLDDKWLLKKMLKKNNLPVPNGRSVCTLKKALSVFEKIEKPVIVKPELGSRGKHTTTFIYDTADLEEAYKIAKQLGAFVMVEEMLMGSVYRATYVGGEIVGILRGDQAKITGDGKKTINELVEEKNKNKKSRVKDFIFTTKEEDFIKRQGYERNYILEKDKTIQLSEKIGLAYGGDAVEIIDKTHPKILDIMKKAGDALGAPVIGFDFIIPDPTSDPSAQKWGIIEANSLPFIDLHHFPNEGTPINVARKIWDLWKK